MGGGFSTDAELMQRSAAQVEEVRNNVDQAVGRLQSEIEPVLASWHGNASRTFRKLMDQFQENANVITTQLQEISDNIKTSGQDYARRDEEQAAEVSKIEGMLNG
ncbi:WXG100 family type VII secretion target [Actinopolyspora mortivallis]|uniref:ESAT-6-like protein n=1 Tax=Actinopolyspora mortivallis TaxID=33906 RepID=A0A2T0GVH9_ACTMO|nr:WXG100 family type VII secretion target [Actinopolyspora mortivallis]PRW63119.1 WXG100 family type VII secretion target [Actinopolyspora mortivallis]